RRFHCRADEERFGLCEYHDGKQTLFRIAIEGGQIEDIVRVRDERRIQFLLFQKSLQVGQFVHMYSSPSCVAYQKSGYKTAESKEPKLYWRDIMKISYHGHSVVKIQTGGKTILIDPFITGNELTDL